MKEGWPKLPLGDLCDVVGGGTPSKDNRSFYKGETPWATVRDMRQDVITQTEFYISDEAINNSSTNVIPSGNVVIATRVGLGKVCLLAQDTAINQDLRGIIPRDPRRLIVQYLYWWLRSVSSLFIAEGTGATVQGVKLPFVKSLEVPLPSPGEQQRIAALLDEAFADLATAKAKVEQNLQNARTLLESHLQELFEAGRQNWETCGKSLIELCELIVDCEHKTAPTQAHGIPSIRTPNIGKGRLLLDGVNRVSEETYLEWTRRAEPRGGDLILAREAPAGNVAVIPSNTRVCLGQRTVLIRPQATAVESSFLAFMLLEPATQARLLEHSRGATVQHLNMRDIRALTIKSLPTISEQRAIAATLLELEKESQNLTHLYERKLAALEELKTSLLHQAFNGEL
jgi:type I restriction enzyme S subunit